MSTTNDASRKRELRAGLALILAAVAGIVCANSPLADDYERILRTPFTIALGDWVLAKPVLLWINDGLMALFFLLVAVELKRERLDGHLSKPGQMNLPLAAAAGGIVLPASIYAVVNSGDPEAMRGWAIPAATDIAFALGVLAMVGRGVPLGLKAFLLSVAVFDDVAAILIIVVFYTAEVSWAAKGLALLVAGVLYGFNRAGLTRLSPYLVVGAALWLAVLKSGVHATLAGVIVGLMIPHRQKNEHGASTMIELEHSLHPWAAYLIVPVFAFANAGVSLAGGVEVLANPVTLGIVGGLVVGKAVGIVGASALAVRVGFARLPQGATWTSMVGVAMLAGIGFTMSLFIGALAFDDTAADLGAPLRIGVLVGSLVSAVGGVLLLRWCARNQVAAA